MSFILSAEVNPAAAFALESVVRPSVRGHNRLEGRPRSEDFSRSLRAEARDPIWFLTRQWQFGELKGDDAGSPIDARIKLESAQLTRYAARSRNPVPFPRDLPLEAVVEREPVPHDLTTVRQVVGSVRRALDAQGLDPVDRDAVLAFYRGAYPLTVDDLEGFQDMRATTMLGMALRNLFHAQGFLAAVASGAHDTQVDADASLSGTARAAAKSAASAVEEVFAGLYSQPEASGASAWEPRQLEYRFDCETAPGPSGDRLAATEYREGRLDWSAFDHAPPRSNSGTPRTTSEVLSFIPAAVTFAAMPAPRFWEMEDRRVEFADISAGTTDTAKLLLTEFALAYANDWVLIPVEVTVGSLCTVAGLVVRDVFGENCLIRPAGRGPDDDWQRWSMFRLSTFEPAADPRLLVPPTTPTLMEPAPIERVVFLRDEMANMCWAVERTVPSMTGDGISLDRRVDATEAAGLQPPRSRTDIQYRLGTAPPSNWFPFIPVQIPGGHRSVRLQRARLPGPARKIRGRIIHQASPYFINEEEIPRSGRIATRGFQRCRWFDGKIVTWLGRRVTTGRGEGSSGMRFDTLST